MSISKFAVGDTLTCIDNRQLPDSKSLILGGKYVVSRQRTSQFVALEGCKGIYMVERFLLSDTPRQHLPEDLFTI